MKPDRVRHVPIFQLLSPQRLERLLAGAELQHYERGATIFRQGDVAEAVWVVLEGWVHLVRSPERDNGSHAVVLFTITPREALCGISALDSGTLKLSGAAGTDCRLIRIPSGAFIDALRHEPEFAYEVVRLCARRIQNIAQQYGAMAEPVLQRIIRTILRLREQFGDTLPVTHREIAQMAWTTTESAIRTVRRLKHLGVVQGTRGQLTLRNIKHLEHLLSAPNGRGR